MGVACSTYDKDGKQRILIEKPERKSSLGKLRSRWEDNFKTCLKFSIRVSTRHVLLFMMSS
jgi:hypothetical protein